MCTAVTAWKHGGPTIALTLSMSDGAVADGGSPAAGPARVAAAVLRNELGDLKDERKQLKRTLKQVSKNIRNEDLREGLCQEGVKVCFGTLKSYGTHNISISRYCIF